MFAYSSSILNKEDVSSIQPQKVILVRVVDMTANGTVAFDAKQHINSLQYEVSKNRPDLKPQMVSINGNPAWGTEGGDNAGIVVVKYANGTEFSRYTQPAPSSLLLIMGNIEYQIDGYVPLNELEQFAESIK